MKRHAVIVTTVLLAALTVSSTVFGQEAEKATSGRIKIIIKNNVELEGSPVEIEEIKINSIFGEATIPLHTIAGIRFSQSPSEQSTVVLLNGDALTGEIALSDLRCVADWGEAKVNVQHIISVVFRPDLAWSSVTTPNGPRWQLKKVGVAGQRVFPPTR